MKKNNGGFRVGMWIGSFVAHVAVISLIVFVKPVRDFLFSRAEIEGVVVSHDRLQSILADMLELHRHKSDGILDGLSAVHREMVDIRDRQFKRLSELRNVTISIPGQDTKFPESHKSATYPASFDKALEMEDSIVDLYRQIRAARVVMVRSELSLVEAMDTATVIAPARAAVSNDTFRLPIAKQDADRLTGFKRELKRTWKELLSVQAYCGKILGFAQEIAADTGLTLNIAGADALSTRYSGLSLVPDESTDTHATSMGGFKPVPGRKMTGKMDPNMWMFLDSWHVIGPFPNERRRLMDTRFGPEAGVDLDAAYVGLDGKELRWNYLRSASWRIEPPYVPPYAIFYGYTEVYADRDRDVWVAMGTDDHGKLWINQELVWTSISDRKSFKADEHVEMVKIKAGYNQILMRCENAGGTMGFCLLFCTAN